jgi:hypothetical protein
MNEENPNSGVIGLVKLIVSLTVMLVAGLAIALVFDVIPESVFSEGVQKVGLLALIVGLAAAALVLVSRVGK